MCDVLNSLKIYYFLNEIIFFNHLLLSVMYLYSRYLHIFFFKWYDFIYLKNKLPSYMCTKKIKLRSLSKYHICYEVSNPKPQQEEIRISHLKSKFCLLFSFAKEIDDSLLKNNMNCSFFFSRNFNIHYLKVMFFKISHLSSLIIVKAFWKITK